MLYEVELRGFDPKEDMTAGATVEKFVVETELRGHTSIIAKVIRENPFKKTGVHWNQALSKVVRSIE